MSFQLILIVLALFQSMLLICLGVYLARKSTGFPVLDGDHYRPTLRSYPRVSVVVAAKDEQDNIAACLNSLLSQQYPNLEIIAVNDRSGDGTEDVINSLARTHSRRLHPLHIKTLPQDWGGQTHAIHQGVLASTGHWLCFTDADCLFQSPHAIEMAIAAALEHNSDFLSLLPQLATKTLWERFYLPVFSFVHSMRLRILDVNNPDSSAAYANGSFMLIKRDVYTQLGGHQAVKNVINDDTRLAKLAKCQNISLRLLGTRNMYKTSMYPSFRSAWFGWTRNTYSSMGEGISLYRFIPAVFMLGILPWTVFLLLVLSAQPAHNMAIWTSPLLLSHLLAAVVYHGYNFRSWWSIIYFPSAVFALAVLLNSLWKSLRKADVIWHGIRYNPSKTRLSEGPGTGGRD